MTRVKALLWMCAVLLPLTLCPVAAHAQTTQDAMDVLSKAVAAYTELGDKAFPAFADAKGPYRLGTLYVTLIAFDGLCLFDAVAPKSIGKNLADAEDVNGKKYMAEMIQIAKTTGSGNADYMAKNPVTGKIEVRTSFLRRIPGKDVLLMVGLYRSN